MVERGVFHMTSLVAHDKPRNKMGSDRAYGLIDHGVCGRNEVSEVEIEVSWGRGAFSASSFPLEMSCR